MKPERWVFGGLGLFYLVVTPVYWFTAHEVAGTWEYLAVLVRARCRHHVPRPDLRLVDLSARAGHWYLGRLGLGF